MDWNKDSVADANFAKIDLLSLPVLDQLDEALDLIEKKEGRRPDLGRIDPEDPEVYDMINAGRSKGVFLLQSPAQLKMGQRLKSRTLLDLAYQVALIRPGRRRSGKRRGPGSWSGTGTEFLGIRPSSGGTGSGAGLRHHRLAGAGGAAHHGCGGDDRRPGRRDQEGLRQTQQRAPRRRATEAVPGGRSEQRGCRRGCEEDIREDQRPLHVPRVPLPRLRRHRISGRLAQAPPSLEFFVALMNNQPMGFYPLETLKEDARRFGVPFLNPCENRSQVRCIPDGGSVLIGLEFIRMSAIREPI